MRRYTGSSLPVGVRQTTNTPLSVGYTPLSVGQVSGHGFDVQRSDTKRNNGQDGDDCEGFTDDGNERDQDESDQADAEYSEDTHQSSSRCIPAGTEPLDGAVAVDDDCGPGQSQPSCQIDARNDEQDEPSTDHQRCDGGGEKKRGESSKHDDESRKLGPVDRSVIVPGDQKRDPDSTEKDESGDQQDRYDPEDQQDEQLFEERYQLVRGAFTQYTLQYPPVDDEPKLLEVEEQFDQFQSNFDQQRGNGQYCKRIEQLEMGSILPNRSQQSLIDGSFPESTVWR